MGVAGRWINDKVEFISAEGRVKGQEKEKECGEKFH